MARITSAKRGPPSGMETTLTKIKSITSAANRTQKPARRKALNGGGTITGGRRLPVTPVSGKEEPDTFSAAGGTVGGNTGGVSDAGLGVSKAGLRVFRITV